jgi:tetratricopeptide (TPR) repeat protein/predicted aspartyl protease
MGGRAVLFACVALAIAGFGASAQAAESCHVGKVAELPTTMRGMVPSVTLKIDGVDTTFMVDSGAFFSVLHPEAAERLKLPRRPAPFGYSVRGVGGYENRVDVATSHSFEFAGIKVPNVPFLVVPSRGGATDGILGQNVLSAWDTEYDLGNGVIRLMKPVEGCKRANLGYWAADGQSVGMVDIEPIRPQEDPHLRGEALINGQKVRVMFDTGASTSVLKLSTAERLGFNPQAASVRAAGVGGGIGSRVMENWVAPFDSFEVGGEKISHTQLRVAAFDLPNTDMLLGADFFLSHRVYVSRQQHRLFFTYNGGPVFRLERPFVPPPQMAETAPAGAAARPGAPTPASPAPAANAQYADTPTDAAGYTRRGEASMSRRDFAAALADFVKASDLEPKEPQHFRDRARAHLAMRQPVLAMADFDAALALKPDDPVSLMGRGELYLASRDLPHAKNDFEAAMKGEPGRAPQVAALYAASGHYEEAIAGYDAWIAAHEKAENVALVLNARCWTRTIANRELDKALADCDLALRKGPKIAAFYDSRGLTHLRRGELDLALVDYNEALKLQPKLAWALYGRGLAKLGKGDRAQPAGAGEALWPGADGPDGRRCARRRQGSVGEGLEHLARVAVPGAVVELKKPLGRSDPAGGDLVELGQVAGLVHEAAR